MALIDLGKPFSLKNNDISDSRFNAKMVTIDTDINLFNMTDKIPGQVMIPRSTGNGFTKNQPCFRSVDNANTIIPIGLAEHHHTSDNASDGGYLIDANFFNVGNVLTLNYATWQKSDFFIETSGTTGAATSDEVIGTEEAAIHLESGTVAGGYANIRVFGVSQDFGWNSIFMCRNAQNGPFTSYLAKFGINCEHISEANSNSRKQYGWESCSGNSNWQCFSCDGTTRSVTTSSFVVNSNADAYEAQHYPGDPGIVYKQNHGSGTAVTKTNNIPTTGTVQSARAFQMGITTTNTATKVMHWYGVVVQAVIGDTDWQWFA